MRQPTIIAYAHNDVLYIRPVAHLGASFALWRDATARGHFDTLERSIALCPEDADEALGRLRSFANVEVQASFTIAQQNARARDSRREMSLRARLAHSKLYPYQVAGAEWLAPRRKALLADEMGLGKTAQILLALPRSRATIVCPAIAIGTWERELSRWRKDLRPLVMSRKSFRPAAWYFCNTRSGT